MAARKASALDRAKRDLQEAQASYRFWASQEGTLTRGEREQKTAADLRIQEIYRRIERLTAGQPAKMKTKKIRHAMKGRHVVGMRNIRSAHRGVGRHAFAKGRHGAVSSGDQEWAAAMRNRARIASDMATLANANKPAHIAAMAHERAATAHEKASRAQIPGSSLAGIHREYARGHKEAASYLRQEARSER